MDLHPGVYVMTPFLASRCVHIACVHIYVHRQYIARKHMVEIRHKISSIKHHALAIQQPKDSVSVHFCLMTTFDTYTGQSRAEPILRMRATRLMYA